MEKIMCKKYGGRIELLVAVQYYDDSNVCASCFAYDPCRQAKEQSEIEEVSHGE